MIRSIIIIIYEKKTSYRRTKAESRQNVPPETLRFKNQTNTFYFQSTKDWNLSSFWQKPKTDESLPLKPADRQTLKFHFSLFHAQTQNIISIKINFLRSFCLYFACSQSLAQLNRTRYYLDRVSRFLQHGAHSCIHIKRNEWNWFG